MILLIENESLNLKEVSKILDKYGWKFEVASCGSQALELISNGDYSLILSDIFLPDMNIFKFSCEVRSRELGGFEHIPIIVLTHICLSDFKIKCDDNGIDDYFVKPLNHNEFYKKIEYILKNRFEFEFNN